VRSKSTISLWGGSQTDAIVRAMFVWVDVVRMNSNLLSRNTRLRYSLAGINQGTERAGWGKRFFVHPNVFKSSSLLGFVPHPNLHYSKAR